MAAVVVLVAAVVVVAAAAVVAAGVVRPVLMDGPAFLRIDEALAPPPPPAPPPTDCDAPDTTTVDSPLDETSSTPPLDPRFNRFPSFFFISFFMFFSKVSRSISNPGAVDKERTLPTWELLRMVCSISSRAFSLSSSEMIVTY